MQVLEVDGDEMKLSFMKEKKKNGNKYYVWADEDLSWENKSTVAKKLKAGIVESISNNRLMYYEFDI